MYTLCREKDSLIIRSGRQRGSERDRVERGERGGGGGERRQRGGDREKRRGGTEKGEPEREEKVEGGERGGRRKRERGMRQRGNRVGEEKGGGEEEEERQIRTDRGRGRKKCETDKQADRERDAVGTVMCVKIDRLHADSRWLTYWHETWYQPMSSELAFFSFFSLIISTQKIAIIFVIWSAFLSVAISISGQYCDIMHRDCSTWHRMTPVTCLYLAHSFQSAGPAKLPSAVSVGRDAGQGTSQVKEFISETPVGVHEKTSMKEHLVRHDSKHKIQVPTTKRRKQLQKQKQNRKHFQNKNNEKPENRSLTKTILRGKGGFDRHTFYKTRDYNINRK